MRTEDYWLEQIEEIEKESENICQKLRQEIKALKEENRILKEELEKVTKAYSDTSWILEGLRK